jgi:arylsulfatase A-like enzyme
MQEMTGATRSSPSRSDPPDGSHGGGTGPRLAQNLRGGLIRGLGFGVAYAVAEALVAYVPVAIRMHLQVPLDTFLTATAFNLAFGALLGLLCSPLLSRRRGKLAHALACTALLAGVSWLTGGEYETAWLLNTIIVAGTLAIYALGLAMGRLPRLAPVRLPGAVLLLGGAFAVPALLTPPAPPLPEVRSAPPEGAPNLLFIVIDTVRADRFARHGRETAPVLARFAREGAVFERAISPATFTLPAHASMFTGLYPSAHGAHHEGNHLAASNTTLAEILHERGWITVGFNANPFITASNGMAQGFERLDPSWLMMTATPRFLGYRIAARLGVVFADHGASEVTEGWTKWVSETWDGKRPFFAFLNYIESHFPYNVLPPEERDRFVPEGTDEDAKRRSSDAAMGAQLFGDPVSEEYRTLVLDLYDAGIHYDDAMVARAIDALRQRDALDRTVVIIASDHGEMFGELGLYGHLVSMSESLLHVPLVIRYPPRVPPGLRIQTPVSTTGLFSTALDLLGVPPPANAQAASFAPLFDGDAAAAASPLLSEQHKFKGMLPGTYKEKGPFDRLGVRYRAFEEEGWKLVEDSEGNRWLFRPEEDPEETQDLAGAYPDRVARLASKREAVTRALGLGALDADKLGPGGHVALDPAARERLKSLGYLQ